MLFEKISFDIDWNKIKEDRKAAIRCLRNEIEISLDCVKNIADDCISGEKSFEKYDEICIDLLIAEYKVLQYLLDLEE